MLTPEYFISDLTEKLVIKVKFQGVSASKCDLVVTDSFAKFNLNPYFLVINFPELVSVSNVIASAKGQEIQVHIGKEEPKKWPPQPWEFPDKSALKRRQEEALERLIEYDRRKAELAKEREEANKKAAMQKSWDIEKEQKKSIKDAIEEEKKYAQRLLAGEFLPKDELKDKPLYESSEVAPVRSRQTCKSVHTPTLRDLPARYDGPQRNFVVPQKGDASPLWMRKSGDEFYKDGAYSSAINAYTQAIEGSDRQYVSAFSNRALARIKLGYFEFALADCNDGLSLIKDPVVSREVAKAKVRLLSRKVYCLYKLKRYIDAFQANAEILKYTSKDAKLDEDIKQIALLAGDKVKQLKVEQSNIDIEALAKFKQIEEEANKS